MNKEKIQNWFFKFFEFSTKDRSTVTSVSCKFFGEYVFNKQQERILELEKENLILKAHYCLDALSVNINKLMLDKLQAKRDLEQQAKGIEDLIAWFEEHCNKFGLAHSLENIAPNYAKKLRKQAKGSDL